MTSLEGFGKRVFRIHDTTPEEWAIAVANATKYAQDPRRLLYASLPKKAVYGFIYLIHKTGTNKYKIGVTTHLAKRASQIISNSGDIVSVLAFADVPDFLDVEDCLHSELEQFNTIGEWFELTNLIAGKTAQFITDLSNDRWAF